MSRRPSAAARGAAAALAIALAACPLPQPVTEYPATGVVPAPRILMDAVTPIDTVLLVPESGCGTDGFTLSASLLHADTSQTVFARWFVDYDTTQQNSDVRVETPVPSDPTAADPTIRVVPPYVFHAYGFLPQTAGSLHVVELVVSQDFAADPSPLPPGWRPNRTPSPQFQTQTYRWVFHYVAPGTPGASCGYPATP